MRMRRHHIVMARSVSDAANQGNARKRWASGPGLLRFARNDGLRGLALAGALFAATAAHAAEPQTVVIDNFAFKPDSITVAPGTHVVFRNQDDLPHTVVVPDMKVKSPMMDTDGSFEVSFDKPGAYKYFCGIHPMMTGQVVVK
jgi:plastocyanin